MRSVKGYDHGDNNDNNDNTNTNDDDDNEGKEAADEDRLRGADINSSWVPRCHEFIPHPLRRRPPHDILNAMREAARDDV